MPDINIIPRENEKHKVPLVFGSGSGCSSSVVGDMILKHLKWDVHDKWFSTYQKLREFEPRLIEVYEYHDRKIYMKYLDGLPLISRPWNNNFVNLEIYGEVLDILKNIGQWNLENNMCFLNHACNLRNFMIENQTGRIYMIDPDSFHFYE